MYAPTGIRKDERRTTGREERAGWLQECARRVLSPKSESEPSGTREYKRFHFKFRFKPVACMHPKKKR